MLLSKKVAEDKDLNNLSYFTVHFPDLKYYIAESYKKSFLLSPSDHPFTSLSNYANFATLLFLFTHAPESELNEDLSNSYYTLPLLVKYFYKPFNTVHTTDTFTFTTYFTSNSPISLESILHLPIFNSQLLRETVYVPVRKTNTAELSQVFVAYYDEIMWFELYGQVKYCNKSLEEKDAPAVKLYYPEPFVATPSFIHEDVWFLHILRYAHWLWFFFISLIILFFITFINTVRWCNYRVKPKRETRGVSRSKCADLITACVPVSWAISIIVSESTDAIDYYDGFGTGELVLGIRAYQWGWQYYYPKAIDTTYSALPNYSNLVGKSTLSVSSTSSSTTSNQLWRHYQTSDLNNFSNTATHTVLAPSINSKISKFIDLNHVGLNTLKSTDSFKKIQKFSKVNNSALFVEPAHSVNLHKKVKSLYLTDLTTTNSLVYGTTPQHNFTSVGGSHRLQPTYFEPKALKSYLNYTLSSNSTWDAPNKTNTLSTVNNKLSLGTSSGKTTTFSTPTTYVDYDLTTFKHARQVETLYWESRLGLTYPTIAKRLTYNPNYESYYINLGFTCSNSVPAQFFTLPDVPSMSTFTTRLLNPTLLNLESYNLFFLKTFNTRWLGEYGVWKSWGILNSLSGTHGLINSTNNLNPINVNVLLTYYPSTDLYHYLKSDSFTSYSKGSLLSYLPSHFDTFESRLRYSNNLSIRSSAKESITSYNALRKVFKARFDEGRANLSFNNIVDLSVTAPFINMPRVPFEVLLQKNSSDFFSKVTYVPKFSNTFSSYIKLDSLLNFYLTDLPFLKSLKSDASRYIWFDWGSRWEWLEVQPSSIARYSLLGVPYSRSKFIYNSGDTKASKLLNSSLMVEAENYFKRLSYSRKNYTTNWVYSPHFYTRLVNQNSSNIVNYSSRLLQNLLLVPNSSSSSLWVEFYSVLTKGAFYWSVFTSTDSVSGSLSAITTPMNTPGRSFTKPLTGFNHTNYTLNKTSYLLSKREDFYRQYLSSAGYGYFLSQDLINSPNNFFVSTVKSNTGVGDAALFSPEGTRLFDVYRGMSTVPSFLGTVLDYVHGNINSRLDTLNNFDNIQKNQYRPMRKGITSMVRLHATNAVALPSEMRIHILASSKDVIHSWAIPSAGIKIDCVPGYSSHRIAIFLNSGIYWGQCMEICGRFHHWMPIVLYIMKRDAFFIWVTHFIHYDKNRGEFTNTSNMPYSEASRVVLNSNLFDYKLGL